MAHVTLYVASVTKVNDKLKSCGRESVNCRSCIERLCIYYNGCNSEKCNLLGCGFVAKRNCKCAGFFIDNQRGAGMASQADPLSGEETSPTGSFLFQSAVYVFFSTGAFLTFLGLVYASYEFWPVWELMPAEPFRRPGLALFFAGTVSELVLDMMLLSGPIVVACLLTDISLGLINRFASQLNVYVLAMPIKSGLASLLLIFYFSMLMTGAVSMFDSFGSDLHYLRVLMP